MKKRILFVAAIGFMAATVTYAQSIVGEWEAPGQTPDGAQITNLIKFTEDGKMTVDFGSDGIVEVYSTYSMDGNKVSLKDIAEDSPCYNQVGIYAVEIGDTEMTAQLVEDPCDARRGDGQPMTMKRAK